MDAADNLSKFFSFYLTCIFYAPIIPHVIPIALFGTIWTYWIWKIMFLRVNKRPEIFSEFLATFFAEAMPYVGLLWALSFGLFVQIINKEILEQKTTLFELPKDELLTDDDLVKTESSLSVIFACCFACLAVLCPMRLFIKYCCVKAIENEIKEKNSSQKTYTDMAHKFPTDYDRENPLTKKEGTERHLNEQKKRALASGD